MDFIGRRQRERGRKAQDYQRDGEAPGQFFDEIRGFFDSHQLIGTDDTGRNSATLGVLDENDKYEKYAYQDDEDGNGCKHGLKVFGTGVRPLV